jgi:glycosyltransferase involved in cell wall biosynthesis
MNILVDGRIWSLYSAGVGTFFTSAILEWAHQSAQDTFYIIVPKGLDARYELRDIPSNIKLLDYSGRAPKFLPNIVLLQVTVPRLCRMLHIDLYYSPVPHLPFMIPSRVKTLVTVHDVVNIEMAHTMSWTNRMATAFAFGRSVSRASYLWTNTEYTRSKVEEYFPKRSAKDIFVGGAVDRKVFYPRILSDDAVKDLKGRYGIKDRFILFVGSLEPRKNLQFLLSIIGDLYREHRLQLVVVGAKRWKESSLRSIIEDPGFPTESTVFCGYVSNDELAALYSVADCFVSAALMEGFGMPQLEAMLCGCPVVTANNTAMAEVARAKDAAFPVDGYEPELWKKTIMQVVNDKPKVNPVQLEQYDWQLIISRLLTLRIG